MSLIQKDKVIKDCADAYRAASGTTEPVKVGELATLISSLTAGGGADLPKVFIGTYTLTENSSTLTVTHNLGTTNIIAASMFAKSFEGVELTANRNAAQMWVYTEYPNYVSASFTADSCITTNSSYYYSNKYSRVVGGQAKSLPVIIDENNFQFNTNAINEAGVEYTVVIVGE